MKKKKPFGAWAGCLLAAALFASGCIRVVPLEPEGGPSAAEAICEGVYADPTEDGTETAQFLYAGGLLLCEADDEFAAYFAEEIIPDDPAQLLSPADGIPDIPVTVRRFSSFSMAGEYWSEGERYRMLLTEDAILFLSTDGGEDYTRTRSAGASPERTIDEAQSAMESRFGPAAFPEGITGKWTDEGEDRLLLIREDGGFLFVLREEEHPPRVFTGACRIGEDGRLRCLTGRTGWAGMPFEGEFSWELTDSGTLILSSDEAGDPILGARDAVFTPGDFAVYGALREGVD